VPRLKKEGVKLFEDVHQWGGTRAAMIEHLDGLAIDHAHRTEGA